MSEVFAPDESKSTCFTFWYHALGPSVGSLRIYMADTNVTTKTLLWSINGQQSINSTDWKQGVLPIINIQNNYVLVIEGVVGGFYAGDIRLELFRCSFSSIIY